MKKTLTKIIAICLAFTGLVAIAAIEQFTPVADAANMKLFKDGEIISDNNFYTTGTMKVAEIQTFLNTKGKNCKADGKIPCIKDYKVKTTKMTKDGYCNGYPAGKVLSAADLIAEVSKSCKISEKALLVILQKEQGMITANKPTDWMYTAAMGFDCPDDGTCNKDLGGLFLQLYKGARVFNYYKDNPTAFNYSIGSNKILYHPNEDCGRKTVNIKNWATAGLYIYTPYTPNKKALETSHGEGDSCSSYGNRNFFSYYSEWFGNPVGSQIEVKDQINEKWQAEDSGFGDYGWPTEVQKCKGDYCYQIFDGGAIFYQSKTKQTFALKGQYFNKYNEIGGGDSWIGFPAEEQKCEVNICSLKFTNGIMYFDSVSKSIYAARFEEAPIKFTDISKIEPIRKADIEWLAAAGVTFGANCNMVTGGNNKTGKCEYAPNNKVNRGAMAEFMKRIVGKTGAGSGNPRIDDLATIVNNPNRKIAVRWLANEKITVVDAASKWNFNPNNSVNRGAMAQFLWKLAGSPKQGDLSAQEKQFKNDKDLNKIKKSNKDRYTAVLWLAKMKITLGSNKEQTKFAPNAAVNRGAMAQFLRRTYYFIITGEPAPEDGKIVDLFLFPTPPPAPTPTPSPSPSVIAPSLSPSPTITPVPSASPTPTVTPTPAPSVSPSPSPSH